VGARRDAGPARGQAGPPDSRSTGSPAGAWGAPTRCPAALEMNGPACAAGKRGRGPFRPVSGSIAPGLNWEGAVHRVTSTSTCGETQACVHVCCRASPSAKRQVTRLTNGTNGADPMASCGASNFLWDGGPSCHDLLGSRAFGLFARAFSVQGDCDSACVCLPFRSQSLRDWGPLRRSLSRVMHREPGRASTLPAVGCLGG
jgi:hypothetical protein